jgi:hypothetical protein
MYKTIYKPNTNENLKWSVLSIRVQHSPFWGLSPAPPTHAGPPLPEQLQILSLYKQTAMIL